MNATAPGSSRRIWRILLVVAVIVGGLSIYGQFGLDDENSPDTGLEAATDRPFSTAPSIPAPKDSDEITARLEQPLPTLDVKVVDLDGNPLTAAALKLEGPYDRLFEGVGAGKWEKMAPGPWTAKAEVEGYFPAEQGFNLQRGEDESVEVAMRPAAIIEGEIKNTYGRTMGAVQVLFLQEGEEHPSFFEMDEFDYPKAELKGRGKFISPPLKAGRYRLSVRGAGRIDMQSEYVQIEEGQRKLAEIILDRGGFMRMEFEGNLELPERGAQVHLMEKDAKVRRQTGEERVRWRSKDRERISSWEPLLFDKAKAGEYKVRLELGKVGRFESEESFLVDENQPMIVKVTLPAGAMEGKGPHPLAIKVITDGVDMPVEMSSEIRWLN